MSCGYGTKTSRARNGVKIAFNTLHPTPTSQPQVGITTYGQVPQCLEIILQKKVARYDFESLSRVKSDLNGLVRTPSES